MFYLILGVLFSLLTGLSKAVMDTLSLNELFDNSILKRWKSDFFDSKERTWGNKWRRGLRQNGERFPLSSTALVWLTDGWHAAQFATSFFGTIAVVLGALFFAKHSSVFYTLIWTAAGFWTLRGLAFETALFLFDDTVQTRALSSKGGAKPNHTLGWFWWIGALLFLTSTVLLGGASFSVASFITVTAIVSAVLGIFSFSGNLRRWANWNSFAFVSAAGAAGFILAIMFDGLRPGDLESDWGDRFTWISIALAFIPGIWAFLISRNWTPYRSEKHFIPTQKAKGAGLINGIWWLLAVAFVTSAILSILHNIGAGPSWWPLL